MHQIQAPETAIMSCHEQLNDLAMQVIQQKAQKSFPTEFYLRINDQFLCHPQAEAILITAAGKYPQLGFNELGRYASAPYAINVLRKIMPEITAHSIEYTLKNSTNLPENIRRFLEQQLQIKQAKESLLSTQLAPKTDQIHLDPRLANWETYQPAWFETWAPKFPDMPLIKLRTIITRNLAALDTPPSQQAVDTAAATLSEQRDAARQINLFRGRNVILAANSEKWRTSEGGPNHDRFGVAPVRNSITSQGGHLTTIRGADQQATDETLEKIKNNLLQKIRITPPPFTFMFDGHGSDVLHLTNDTVNRDLYNRISSVIGSAHGRITVAELASALIDRQKNFPELGKGSLQQQDILIFASCFSQSFAIRVYEIITKAGITPPIITGMSEYGQYGFSNTQSKFASDFAENTLGLKSGTSTIGTVMRQGTNQRTSTPFVYIPYRKKPMQIL